MSTSRSTGFVRRAVRPIPGPCRLASTLAAAAISVLAVIGAARAQETPGSRAREPIISLPCEGCEAVFQGLPDELSAAARIAPKDEPGEPMRIEGTVHDRSGQPAPGVIVYAYHTDARGIYPPNGRFEGQAAYRHGLLRGWARTDERGRYRFETIRPASYPDSEVPAHVHMHLIEPSCCTYYIPSIRFADDPRLSAQDRERLQEARDGRALARPERNENGVWLVTRDIVLGEGVDGYAEKARDAGASDASSSRGQLVLDAALAALGGPDRVRGIATWDLEGVGRENLSAEAQGLAPGRPTWRDHSERVAVDTRTLTVAWQRHTPRNDFSLRWRRLIYGPDRIGFIDFNSGRSVSRDRDVPEERRRALARRVPHLLLLEAATAASRLTWLDDTTIAR